MESPFTFYPDCDNALNLLTDCDQLCHVIHILYLDRIKQDKYSVPPYFQRHVKDTSCHFGKVAKLECEVTGVPEPEVEWYKDEDGQRIAEQLGKYDVIRKAGHVILYVYDVGPDDIGSYTCKIFNIVGESESTGRIFFTPNKNPQSNVTNDLTRLIIEERLRIVERISKERDVTSLTSSALSDNSGRDSSLAMAEKLRLSFAMPPHSHVQDMSVVSETLRVRADCQKDGDGDDVQLGSMSRDATPTPSSGGSRSRGFLSAACSFDTQGDLPTSPMSTSESVFDDQSDSGSLSDGSDQDLNDRVKWIERGESSDSDFRRGSIPYPMSLVPLRSLSLDSGRSSSPSAIDESKPAFEPRRSRIDSEEFEEKMLKLTGLQMSPSIPPPKRSFSSGSQSSGVGSGMIVRVVRALSQNEYFDTFFDKGSEEASDDTFDDNSICKLLALQPTLRESAHEESEPQNNNRNQQETPNTIKTEGGLIQPDGGAAVPRIELQLATNAGDVEVFETECESSVSENISGSDVVVNDMGKNVSRESDSEILECGEKLRRFREVCESFDGSRSDFVQSDEPISIGNVEERYCSSETTEDVVLSLKKLCQNFIRKHADKKSLYLMEENSRNMNELIRNLLEFSDKQLGFRPKTPSADYTRDVGLIEEKSATCEYCPVVLEDQQPAERLCDEAAETKTKGNSSPCDLNEAKNTGLDTRAHSAVVKLDKIVQTVDLPCAPEAEDRDDFRRGSIISFSSVASTTYYSAEDDDMLSETTLDYYSPNEGDLLSTDDFFSPDSEIHIPSSEAGFLPPYLLNRRLEDPGDADDNRLFIPRPQQKSCGSSEIESSAGEDGNFTITAFNSVISEERTTTPDSGEETPVVNEFSDEDEMDIISPPSFKNMLTDVAIPIGSTFTLSCTVNGNPSPSVLWRKDGSPVHCTGLSHSPENRLRTTSTIECKSTIRHSLHVEHVQELDEGVYTACAFNRCGDVTSSCKVHVQKENISSSSEQANQVTRFVVTRVENEHEVTSRDLQCNSASGKVTKEKETSTLDSATPPVSTELPSPTPKDVAPYFDEIMEDARAKSGDDVTMSVCIYGEPPPAVTWSRKGREIEEGNCVRVSDNERHSLFIKNVTPEQSGIYSCRGSNRAGEVECKAELDVAACADDEVYSTDDERMFSDIEKRNLKDDYIVNDVIWSGSFSHVKSVTSRTTSEVFAARFVRSKGGGVALFESEVRILGSLQHKNVVAYCDHYREKRYHVVVTEKCDKELFDHLLEVPVITEKLVAFYFAQLCDALMYLHARNIVHLKLKPENLLLLEQDDHSTLKLIDFSSAKELLPDEPAYWDRGIPDFVAPEIVLSEMVSPATDMWAAGVMTYIALSGISPFAGDTDQATVLRIRDNDWSFNHKEFACVSPEAKSFIESLLGWTPGGRMSAEEACRHAWLATQSCVSLSPEKLKYFQSRRTWQRSLVSPKSSTMVRSIPSLLQGEFDSTSLTVPRSVIDDVTTSTSATESEDEWPAPRKERKPTLRGHTAPPLASAAYMKRLTFSKSRSYSGSMERPLQLSNLSPPSATLTLPEEDERTSRKKLSSIGKKVSFEDEVLASQQQTIQSSDEDVFETDSAVANQLPNNQHCEEKGHLLTGGQSDANNNQNPKEDESNNQQAAVALRKNSRGSAASEEKQSSPTAGCCVRPGVWSRPPPHPSPTTHPNSSPKPVTQKPPKSILKNSLDVESGGKASEEKYPKSGSWKRKPFMKSPSLDVVGRTPSVTDSPTSFRRISAAARRRLSFKRGASAESALQPGRTKSTGGGLRGPLLEQRKEKCPDTDTVGARMRGAIGRFGSLERSFPRKAFKSVGDSPEVTRRNAPQLRTNLRDGDVIAGQLVTLVCAFDVTPPFQVTWMKDNVQLPASPTYVTKNNVTTGECTLTMLKPTLAEAVGKFDCVVTNNHGKAMTSCKLTEAVAPDAPSAPEVTRVQGSDVWITWQAPTTHNLVDVRYLLQCKNSDTGKWNQRDDSIRSTAYHVVGLQPSVTHWFRVAARNKAGIGEFSPVSGPIVLPQP